MDLKKLNVVLAIAAGLLLLLFLGVAAWRWTNPSPESTQVQIASTPKSAASAVGVALPATRPAGDAIKVGWMVSLYTAEEHPYATNGFDSVTAIRPRFLDPQIELWAIVEPDTASDPRVEGVLLKNFPAGHVIDGSDAAALSKLDVIVCSRDWNMRPVVMKAILKAVSNGAGLLRHLGTGIRENEDDAADVAAINCVDDPKFFWTRDLIDCTVVSDHPLLSGIRTTLEGGKLQISSLNGCIGVVHGTPLIVADEGAQDSTGQVAQGLPSTQPTATTAPTDRQLFCPMFISQIGKGRVVACQWDSIPRPLVEATGGRFYIHCVQWLANKPIK